MNKHHHTPDDKLNDYFICRLLNGAADVTQQPDKVEQICRPSMSSFNNVHKIMHT
jgi:hypothetical protein